MLDRTATAVLAGIGHNNPPVETTIDRAKATTTALSTWMASHPAVETEEAAREAKALVDRAKAAWQAMEDERDAAVRPLNTRVKAINDSFKPARTTLEKLRDMLTQRIEDFIRRQEVERQRIAEKARRTAAALAEAAMEAERRRQEAIEDAAQGVCDIDLAAVHDEAEQTISDLARAARVVQRADRDAKVRIGGGFGRVMTMRNSKVLTVTNWKAAIEEMGLTDGIAEAILTAARAYKKACGDFPAGITETTDRSL